MSLFFAWLKSKVTIIVLLLLCAFIYLVSFTLYHLPVSAVLYPGILCVFVILVFGWFDYSKTVRVHRMLERETQTLLHETPYKAGSVIERDYQKITGTLFEKIAKLQTRSDRLLKESEAYYTLWIHQIKTPIAAMDAALQNEDHPLARQLQRNILQISNYVDMVLAYVRLRSDQSDYRFEKQDLDEIISGILSRYSMEFIDRGLALDYRSVQKEIITDQKWVTLILEQLLSNALKYSKKGTIHIRWEDGLVIEDEGIGIAKEDLARIFDKGFTGQNGRTNRYSSGLGLWLVSQSARNLQISIQAESQLHQGTKIRLGFSNVKDLTEL